MRVTAICVCRTCSQWSPEMPEQASNGDVVPVLIEFARCEKTARRSQRFVEFINNGGYTNPGVAGNQYHFWFAWPGTVFNIKHGGVGFLHGIGCRKWQRRHHLIKRDARAFRSLRAPIERFVLPVCSGVSGDESCGRNPSVWTPDRDLIGHLRLLNPLLQSDFTSQSSVGSANARFEHANLFNLSHDHPGARCSWL